MGMDIFFEIVGKVIFIMLEFNVDMKVNIVIEIKIY